MGNGTIHSGKGMEKHVPIMVTRRRINEIIGTVIVAGATGTAIKQSWDYLNKMEIAPERVYSNEPLRVSRYVTNPQDLIIQISPGVYDLEKLKAYVVDELGGRYAPIHNNGVLTSVINKNVPGRNIALGFDGNKFYEFLICSEADKADNQKVAPTMRPADIEYKVRNVEPLKINFDRAEEIFPGLFCETRVSTLEELRNKDIALFDREAMYGEMIRTEKMKVA